MAVVAAAAASASESNSTESERWASRRARRAGVRGGVARRYRAVPVDDPEVRDRIHALMRAKYGFADRYVSLMRSASGSVAVRLDPL